MNQTINYNTIIIGKKELEKEALTVREVVNELTTEYGDKLKKNILDINGNPRRQIKIYLNCKDIRFLNQLDTPLNDGDELLILPAVTGG